MFERIKSSQNMIETVISQSKYLVSYGELFSVLSWQVFKGNFQIIIFSEFTSAEPTQVDTSMRFCLFLLCEL